MICCPSTGICESTKNCASYSGVIAASSFPSGSCVSGVSSMFCSSSSTYTQCQQQGNPFTNLKCPLGTICCPDTNLCDFSYNCPSVPTSLYKGSASTIDICANLLDGTKLCSSDSKSVLTCSGGKTVSSTSCGDGTSAGGFCCDSTLTCSTAGTCPGICSGGKGLHGVCKSPFQFVVCEGKSVSMVVPCSSGTICCPEKQMCLPAADC